MRRSGECTIALVQMAVRGGELDWNLQHAIDLLSEAASHGADVAILPECMDLGWTDPSSLTQAGEIPDGRACYAMRETARQKQIYICCGLTERADDDVYNAAVIIDKEGGILCHHRKINELEIALPYYTRGQGPSVCENEFGTWGLMICADGFAKDLVLSRSLAIMGADVIFSPCAWAVPGDHDNSKEPYGDLWRESYIPVAREFSTAIIGVSNVGEISSGPWAGKKCIGCSLAIGPDGEEVVQGPYGPDAESIIYLTWKQGSLTLREAE